MRLRIGTGGWCRVDDIDLPGVLYVRLQPGSDGRWRTGEVYLDGRGATLTAAMLRSLPLAAVEALAADHDVRTDLEHRARLPAVPVDVLASHFAHTFTSRARHWVAESTRTPVKRAPDPRPRPTDDPPPLRPPDGALTDDFLRQVDRAYRAAVARGEHPAPALAAQTGMSVHAVRKWIYTARRRGIMPPGRQGVVG